MIVGHYDIVCPECGKRMGGCRCPHPEKEKRTAPQPCDECKKAEKA